MKSLIGFLICFLTLSAYAQVDTGSSIASVTAVPEEVLKGLIESHKATVSFIDLLKARDKACGKKIGIFNSGDDIKDIYLKIKFYESMHASPDRCKKRDQLFQCMRMGATKSHKTKYDRTMMKMIQSSSFESYLTGLHQMKQDEAKEMIQYFKNLGEAKK